jgi:hypothetical protein
MLDETKFNEKLKKSVKPVKSVAENISIKNNKLCKTNPISKRLKMNLTHYTTNNYDNNFHLLAMSKQSQNKPNQSQFFPPLQPLNLTHLAKNRQKPALKNPGQLKVSFYKSRIYLVLNKEVM